MRRLRDMAGMIAAAATADQECAQWQRLVMEPTTFADVSSSIDRQTAVV
jgi:hypothetical protein